MGSKTEKKDAVAASAGDSSPSQEKVVFRLNGVWISYAHTFFAASAFSVALITGCLLHFNKIVENEYYGYPYEWFPSVSATIGDRYPERSFYQILIALTSGSRFLLGIFTYILTARNNCYWPKVLFWVSFFRTLSCGGWTYITSTDDHDSHDIFMILYIVLTLPHTILRTLMTPKGKLRTYRTITAGLFFFTLIPLIYIYIQHKVYAVPGAYTLYAFLEWSLVGLDVAFDTLAAYDLPSLEFAVIDKDGSTHTTTSISYFSNPEVLKQETPILGFVVSLINWSIWWSVVTSVGAMLWYFPLWYMGISGYEAWCLTLFSPILLMIPFFKNFFLKYPQVAFLGQVLTIWSYWEPSPPKRMTYTGIGAGFAAIALASTFHSAASSGRSGVLTSQATSLVCALLIIAVIRIPNYTNNPFWPIMNNTNGGQNHWGVALGLVGAAFAGFMVPDKGEKKVKPTTSALFSAFGVAGLFYFFMSFVSESSSIPLWVWEGYPIRGPTPIPHGIIVLFVASLGLLYGLRCRCMLSNGALIGFNAAMLVMNNFANWVGFAGALYCVFYVCAVSIPLLEDAGRHNPAKSFGFGLFALISMYFANIWTVAYAFVPGGWLLRERTWVLMLAVQVWIGLGVLNVDRKLTAANFKKVYKLTAYTLTIALILGTFFTGQRFFRDAPVPLHPETKSFNAGIWTVHFGVDNGLWASETRMADLIRDAELDVVGMLETDTQRIVGGQRDMTQKIAEELGFYADYGPPANKHTWGACLLSRFPILRSEHLLTPSPVGELAPAIYATLNVYGQEVDIIVFHSGQEEDPEDRRLQTEFVSEILHNTSNPTIQLSYLVTPPLQGNYLTWVSDYTGMRDIDPTDDDRWCEYILYKNIKRVAYGRISRDTITDTELQVGKFQIGQPVNYDNEQIDESEVIEDLRMPQILKGNGVRGHRYHVFNAPRYYA